ncbi:hypothetical protein [Streptomyces sulphureus]|nr:hypothetical protein [Streptomyces sulphureus]
MAHREEGDTRHPASFLKGCEEEALPMGNLALGLPGTTPPPVARVEHP